MEEHLARCASCTRAYHNRLALRAASTENDLYRRAAAHVERRLRAALRPPERRTLPILTRAHWLAVGTAAACTILMFLCGPSTAQAGAVQVLTRQGYHLVQWNQSGMTYWAVSDLNTEELEQFVQLMRPAAPTPTP